MRVKMLEVFQGRDVTAVLAHEGIEVSVLENGEEYEVDAELGKWLIDNRKAVAVKPPKREAKNDKN